MTDDRTGGDEFLMTQGFMSHMLGVQRPGINLAPGVVQRAGLVRHKSGIMRVLDRPGSRPPRATATPSSGAARRG